jgi:hypothetical protein
MSQEKININWFEANDEYKNFFCINHSDEDVLRPLQTDLALNGDVWKLEGLYYPLLAKKIAESPDHNQHFDRRFLIKTFDTPDKDDIKVMLEIINNQHHPANATKAHFLLQHENENVRQYAENIVRGKWDHIDFNVSSTVFTEADRIIPREKA